MSGGRRHAPATSRNRDPIAAILRAVLPVRGSVLEIASGTGEHAAHFAATFPHLTWQPSDPDPVARASIEAWRTEMALSNLAAPVAIDASAAHWPVTAADAMLCINMVHISPWAATLGLIDGAQRLLPRGGPLVLYGPYLRDGQDTAPSNRAFDADLRARNACWGLRRVEDVEVEADIRELTLDTVHEMPANNIILIFRRI